MYFTVSYTYRAAINASSSAALTAASSSSLDKVLPVFLSFEYHVKSLPFCHRPTGAIKEFPGWEENGASEAWWNTLEGDVKKL